MVGFRTRQNSLVHFLRGFGSMDDLVLTVTEEGIEAAGTVERAFFVEKWNNFRESEESIGEGQIALGQLDTFLSLVGECGLGHSEIEVLLDDATIKVTGDNASFSIPTVASPASQAGVEVITGYLTESEGNDWVPFGNGEFDFHVQFPASDFQQLRNTGKSIQSGALYCVVIDDESLTLSVKRDQIRIDRQLSFGEEPQKPPEEAVVTWFGRWLMDALKAMPGKGVIHVHGGVNAPLLIRHEVPEDENSFGTRTVIAPRQEEAGESQ